MSKAIGNKNESGQGLVEYAMILALVGVVVIVVLVLVGPSIGHIFSNVQTSLVGTQGTSGQPTSVPTQPALGLSITNLWTGCSGACTDTYVNCTGGAVSFNIRSSSFPNNDPGINFNSSCPAGGQTHVGNYWHNQILTLTNLGNGASQAFQVP